MRIREPRPQFPHGDFVGLADGLAKEIGVYPTLAADDPVRTRMLEGPLVPAQYRLTGLHAKPELARALIADTPAPILDDPPVPPRAVVVGRQMLAMLRGRWAIQRRVEPGGDFTGIAAFTQRSADSLLYRETGEFRLDDGVTLSTENSYVYALRNGVIEVSFATGLSQGLHFIDIALPEDQACVLPIVCTDRHLCRLDTYDATFRMETADRFAMSYVVGGPAKHYVSRSDYRRLDEVH
jgi:hypothetical protein